MNFHLPSFLLGYGAGAGTVLLGRHLRPVFLEVATVAWRFADALAARAAIRREDVEDLFAEARARARSHEKETTGNGHARQQH